MAGRVTEASTWLPRQVARGAARLRGRRRTQHSSLPSWARAEMRRHDVRHLLEAGAELGRYDARPWIGNIDVPTAVVVTERDRAVPSSLQLDMAERGLDMAGLPAALKLSAPDLDRTDRGNLR